MLSLLVTLLAAGLVDATDDRTSRARLQELQGRLGVRQRPQKLKGYAAKIKHSYLWLLHKLRKEFGEDAWTPDDEYEFGHIIASGFILKISDVENWAPKDGSEDIWAAQSWDKKSNEVWTGLVGADRKSDLAPYVQWLAREHFNQMMVIYEIENITPIDGMRKMVNDSDRSARRLIRTFHDRGLIDWIESEGIDIQQFTWGEAIDASRAWHENLKFEDVDFRDPIPRRIAVMRWPDGAMITRVIRKHEYAAESASMKHCIGADRNKTGATRYWQASRDGREATYSYVDPDGVPHATIHVGIPVFLSDAPELQDWEVVTVEDAQGPENQPPADKLASERMGMFLVVLIGSEAEEDEELAVKYLVGTTISHYVLEDFTYALTGVSESMYSEGSILRDLSEYDSVEYHEDRVNEVSLQWQQLHKKLHDAHERHADNEIIVLKDKKEDLEEDLEREGEGLRNANMYEKAAKKYNELRTEYLEELEKLIFLLKKYDLDWKMQFGYGHDSLCITAPDGTVFATGESDEFPDWSTWCTSDRKACSLDGFPGILTKVYGDADGNLVFSEEEGDLQDLTNRLTAAHWTKDTELFPDGPKPQNETETARWLMRPTDDFLKLHGLKIKRGKYEPVNAQGAATLRSMGMQT